MRQLCFPDPVGASDEGFSLARLGSGQPRNLPAVGASTPDRTTRGTGRVERGTEEALRPTGGPRLPRYEPRAAGPPGSQRGLRPRVAFEVARLFRFCPPILRRFDCLPRWVLLSFSAGRGFQAPHGAMYVPRLCPPASSRFFKNALTIRAIARGVATSHASIRTQGPRGPAISCAIAAGRSPGPGRPMPTKSTRSSTLLATLVDVPGPRSARTGGPCHLHCAPIGTMIAGRRTVPLASVHGSVPAQAAASCRFPL